MIRRQLPAYSPLAPGKLLGAAARASTAPERSRAELSRSLLARFRADHVLLTASGTHALQLALELAGGHPDRRGRAVALPAYSCFDVATAAVGAGVPVAFYDIDPVHLTPDERSLRCALDAGAGVVVANSLYGFPLDWTTLRDLCGAAGAILVEDSAQGLGSSWQGSEGGSFGDFTVLSFGRGKGWTGGGGGALLTRGVAQEDLDEAIGGLAGGGRAGDVRALVLSLAQWMLGRPPLFGIPSSIPGLGLGETAWKEPTAPRRIGAFSAAAAHAHSDLAVRETSERRRLAARWRVLFEEHGADEEWAIPRPMEPGSAGYLRLPVVARTRPTGELLNRRLRALGLAAGYPTPLPFLPAFAGATDAPDVPGALALANHLFTVPTHSLVTEGDMRRTLAGLRSR